MAEKAVQGGKHMGTVLKEEGVEYIFGVIGGHIFMENVGIGMAGIKMIHCRHEQAGGYAADGYSRASGKVGVCFGTAGPGMTNQISAIAQAYFCKVPLVAYYGQHGTYEDGRGALQESRADQILNSVTKWTRRIISPKTIAYFTKKAMRDAMTYPQGPVAIELPRDIVAARTPLSQQLGYVPNAYQEPAAPQGNPAAVEKAVRALLAAERPVIAGGEEIRWADAADELLEFVELTQIPVITRRVARGAVPEDHPLAFSGRARGRILRAADVACTIGLNLGFLEGYGAWAAKAKLIQITSSRYDIETTAPTDTIIIGNPKEVLKQMIAAAKDIIKGSPKKEAWLKQIDEVKAEDKKRITEDAEKNKNNKPIHPAWAAQEALAVLDKDASIVLDGFTSSHFVTERMIGKHPGAVLDSGTFAGVGHGVGMGLGAQLARPGKQTLVFMGDGGMGLGGFDVETAVRSHLPVVYFLSNNRAWMAATGRMFVKAMPVYGEQDSHNPWFMVPTDYSKIFAAMGCYTERVEDPAQVRAAVERAFNSGKTAVLDVVVDRTTPPTRGTAAAPLPQLAKTQFAYMDPEDVPDAIRPQMYPDLEKK
jgi:acetolactate synthase-1/2/3 large subunit